MDKKELALKIERLATAARLNAVVEKLDPGVYLIGSGPYSQGVFSLMTDEVVIGRQATPLEKMLDNPVDVFVNDAAMLTPREVSRVHCRIYRAQGTFQHDYFLLDCGSTCGTYLNRDKLEPPMSADPDEIRRVSRSLGAGAVISLGPSGINTFVFADLRG